MGTNPSTTSTTLNLSKVYGSLCAGTIPVYLGAPNVAEHVPPNSVIPVPNNFNEADVAKVLEHPLLRAYHEHYKN